MVIPGLSLHNCGNSVIKNLAVEERLELSHPFKDRLFSRQLPVDRLGLLYYLIKYLTVQEFNVHLQDINVLHSSVVLNTIWVKRPWLDVVTMELSSLQDQMPLPPILTMNEACPLKVSF